jgi:hypothetical protein
MQKYCSNCKYSNLSINSQICSDCNRYSNWEKPANPYWENICAIADRQREKGMMEYGKGLEDNKASIIERINHAQEEAVDFLMYLEWIKDKFGGDSDG